MSDDLVMQLIPITRSAQLPGQFEYRLFSGSTPEVAAQELRAVMPWLADRVPGYWHAAMRLLYVPVNWRTS